MNHPGTVVIKAPPDLTTSAALEFVGALPALALGKSLKLDFSALRWAEPGGMLTTAMAIRRIVLHNENSFVEATGLPTGDYLSHMGFFNACAVPWGRQTGEAAGGPHYLPITRMVFSEVVALARKEAVHPQSVIERQSVRLAFTLCQEQETPTHRVLSFCLTELLRNAFEHSAASEVWFAAQYWPARGEVELAILDDGIGIRRSLQRNPAYSVETDATAIHLAILPGVSASTTAGTATVSYSHWDNSGFGLYMTSQLALQRGRFLVGSGDATLAMSLGRKQVVGGPRRGTLVVLRTSTEWGNIDKSIDLIRRKGDSIARSLHGAHADVGATASRLIREHFVSRTIAPSDS